MMKYFFKETGPWTGHKPVHVLIGHQFMDRSNMVNHIAIHGAMEGNMDEHIGFIGALNNNMKQHIAIIEDLIYNMVHHITIIET